jgi:CO/xanthine dehydrogenase FAD-binding subunit
MLAQFNLYAIIALIIVVIALGGGWYVSNRLKTVEIDTLTQHNATLTSAVETNERTIAQMIADAQAIAAYNSKLTHSIMASEMEQAAS